MNSSLLAVALLILVFGLFRLIRWMDKKRWARIEREALGTHFPITSILQKLKVISHQDAVDIYKAKRQKRS